VGQEILPQQAQAKVAMVVREQLHQVLVQAAVVAHLLLEVLEQVQVVVLAALVQQAVLAGHL
jgi:hypothetical protein